MSIFDDMLSDPRTLNQVGTGLEVGGQLIGAASHLDFGRQAQQAAEYQAAQLRINAGQAQASSQFQAQDIDRQTQLIMSRALAVAASGGGGASDPTVLNVVARDAAEGAYRKAVALYQGNTTARANLMQADAKEFEGENVNANSKKVAVAQDLGAATTLMKGMARDSSLLQRFGGSGPSASSVGLD